MNRPWLTLSLLMLLTPLSRAADAAPPDPKTVRVTWHDIDRDRDVPVLIYLPQAAPPAPTIIFSPGLGGSRDGYSYLGKYWAQHGYVSVHLQHIGSDTSVLQGDPADLKAKLQAISRDPLVAANRWTDVTFAIDQLTKLNDDATSPLHGRINLAHLGMAGHSFGAHTTMTIAGQTTSRGNSHVDNRVIAAVAMSPPNPPLRSNPAALDSVHIPVFELTGTADDSPVGDTKAADRRFTFDHLIHAPAYLAIFDGGDHMLFSGRHPITRDAPNDDRYHALILKSTTLFWDAYLKGDAKATAAFDNGEVRDLFKGAATFENKLGDGAPAKQGAGL